MKNFNNRGFLLTETIIVAVFVLVTMLIIFYQFSNVYTGYNKSFTYNTANGLYSVSNLRDYLYDDGLDNLVFYLRQSTNHYVDITNCREEIFEEVDYCSALFTALNIKQVIFTYSNLENRKADMKGLPVKMNDFIKDIEKNSDDINSIFRIIVNYNDDTFASLKVYR